MTTFADQHPRQDSGRFATKENSEPEAGTAGALAGTEPPVVMGDGQLTMSVFDAYRDASEQTSGTRESDATKAALFVSSSLESRLWGNGKKLHQMGRDTESAPYVFAATALQGLTNSLAANVGDMEANTDAVQVALRSLDAHSALLDPFISNGREPVLNGSRQGVRDIETFLANV